MRRGLTKVMALLGMTTCGDMSLEVRTDHTDYFFVRMREELTMSVGYPFDRQIRTISWL